MKIAFLMLVSCLLAAGSLRAAEPLAPAAGLSLQAVTVDAGVLRAGEYELKRTMIVDRSRSLRLVVAAGDKTTLAVDLPDGSTVTADSQPPGVSWHSFEGEATAGLPLPGTGGRSSALVTFDKPYPGRYVVHLARAGGEGDIPFSITSLPDSDLRMALWVESPYVLEGQPFVLAAVLAAREVPVREAEVTAALSRVDSAGTPKVVGEAILRDDGRDADVREGDGVYSGIVLAVGKGETWVTVRARGRTDDGDDYERTGALVLQGSEATVAIEPCAEPVWRKNGDFVDALLLDFKVEGGQGHYDLTATVRAPNGRSVTGGATLALSGGGEARVEVPSALVKTLGVDGPYVVASVEVHDRAEGARTLRARRPLEWQTPPIGLDRLE